MRHLFHLKGVRFSTDSERPYTHVVLGQRNEAAARQALPDTHGKTHLDLTPQQHADLSKFVFDLTHGWYAVKPLDWAESEAAAAEIKKQFEAAGWINVNVQLILAEHVLTHA